MSRGNVTLSATTDSKGGFSLATAPAGYYKTWAELPPYRTAGQAILQVPETGCGYTDIQLTTTSALRGVVLDRQGRPAPKIPVAVWLREKKLEDATDPWALSATTDQSGQFVIAGLPDADVLLSAGSGFPTTDIPYGRVYYPNSHSPESATVLRLKPGEHHLPIVLLLEARLVPAVANVRVLRDGNPVPNALVKALDNRGVIAESAQTDAQGAATVPCLSGLKYELEAQTLHPRMPWRGNIMKSSRLAFTCDGLRTPSTLVLDHSAPY
jgi:hypothetical protein